MSSYRTILRIPWIDYRTNASILEELGIQENRRLLPSIQRQILKFFGHIIRWDSLEKIIIQGKVQGKRNIGRPPSRFIDQIKDFVGIRSIAEIMWNIEDREVWRNIRNNHTPVETKWSRRLKSNYQRRRSCE